MLAFLLMSTLAFMCIFVRDIDSVNKIILSVLMSQVLEIQDNLIWGMKVFVDL